MQSHPKLALASVIQTKGSTPRTAGAKMVVFPDGTNHGTLGSGKLEYLVIKRCTGGVSQERLNKIYAPTGLDIKTETPTEIAVGILAELIQVRRIGKPSRISFVRIHEGADDKK